MMQSMSLNILVALSILSTLAFAEESWKSQDWNKLFKNYTDYQCETTYSRSLADPSLPDKCPAGYPVEKDLWCAQECPDGWTENLLGLCVEDCTPPYEDVLGVCSHNTLSTEPQGSKGRGVGIIPDVCGPNQVKEGLLCYDKCPSGYKPFGCHCWKGLKAQGRGCGVAPRECRASHPRKQNGLCYKRCPDGYPIEEGPVCWESCDKVSGPDAVDTGFFCQKGSLKTYLPESFIPKTAFKTCSSGHLDGPDDEADLLCFEECKAGYTGVLGTCWNENIGTSIAAVTLSSAQLGSVQSCYNVGSPYAIYLASVLADLDNIDSVDLENVDFDLFLKCAWTIIKTMEALDDSWNMDQGVTVAVTGSLAKTSGPVGISVYGGLAFEFKNKDTVEIWRFYGGCQDVGFGDGGVGLNTGMGIFRNVEAIDGYARYLSMGVELFGAVNAGNTWAFDNQCRVSGMATTLGVSSGANAIPITASVSFGECINFDRKSLGEYTSPAASAAYKPYERTYGARDPYERTYGHAYGAYKPYERTYGARDPYERTYGRYGAHSPYELADHEYEVTEGPCSEDLLVPTSEECQTAATQLETGFNSCCQNSDNLPYGCLQRAVGGPLFWNGKTNEDGNPNKFPCSVKGNCRHGMRWAVCRKSFLTYSPTSDTDSPTLDTDSITFVKRDCRVPDEGNGLGDYGNHNGQPKTLDECMDLCREHTECRSFTYSESGQKCHLKDKVVTEDGGCADGSSWNFETYYSIDDKQSSAAYKPYERTYGAYRRDPYERTYGHAYGAYKPYERTYGARDPYERTYGRYGAYKPYERTYGADAEEEGVLSVLPESTPALIAREKSGFTSVAAQTEANYCCHSETVDGWNGNYNGVCFGHQTEEDCDSNECYWDVDNCRRELTCLLRDVECESNDDCCSGRCKVDDLLCR